MDKHDISELELSFNKDFKYQISSECSIPEWTGRMTQQN